MLNFKPEDFTSIGIVRAYKMCFQASKVANNLAIPINAKVAELQILLDKANLEILSLKDSVKLQEKMDNLAINGGPFT